MKTGRKPAFASAKTSADKKASAGKKVCIAMSGGVDSSVAAGLLKNQGYDCIGIFMKFWSEAEGRVEAPPNGGVDRLSTTAINKCCSAEAFQTARRVAHQLGFPIYTLNFQQPFKKQVVDDFLNQYQKGFTPNPCIRCNKLIKFDLLWQKAKMLGCDYLATGHYIKNSSPKTQAPKLYQAKDKKKDQSYFLYTLKSNQLKHLLFPLGNYTKTQVRALAKKWRLPAASRPDSQEICFTPAKNHYSFLKRYLKLKPGPIVTIEGKKVGQHEGLPLYTLGQRKGIKVGGIGPFYVVKMDYKNNRLIVSNKKDDPALLIKKFTIKEANWVAKKPTTCQVKIRYQAPSVKCKIVGNVVTLGKLQRAVMSGQSAVFYQGKRLLGGGVIDKIK